MASSAESSRIGYDRSGSKIFGGGACLGNLREGERGVGMCKYWVLHEGRRMPRECDEQGGGNTKAI